MASNLRELVETAVLQGRLEAAQKGIKKVVEGQQKVYDLDAEIRKANDFLATIPDLCQKAAAKGFSKVVVMELKKGEHHNVEKVGGNYGVTPNSCFFWVQKVIENLVESKLQPQILKTIGSDVYELEITFDKV